jgi:CBS domain-containing protein
MSTIRDVMSQDYKFMTPDQTVQQAAQEMQNRDIGFLPVGENDRLIGMVTDRDIVLRSAASGISPAAQPIRDVMSPQVYYCYDDQNVDEICQNMAETKVRRMPVVNRDKRLVGIVSLGDLSQVAHRAKAGDTLQEITNQQNQAQQAA